MTHQQLAIYDLTKAIFLVLFFVGAPAWELLVFVIVAVATNARLRINRDPGITIVQSILRCLLDSSGEIVCVMSSAIGHFLHLTIVGIALMVVIVTRGHMAISQQPTVIGKTLP